MAGYAEHENVGTRAKNFFLGAGHNHRADFRVLEANAADGVVQLNIDAEVVAVELELVTRTQAAVFINIDRQRGDGSIEAQFPVFVL